MIEMTTFVRLVSTRDIYPPKKEEIFSRKT